MSYAVQIARNHGKLEAKRARAEAMIEALEERPDFVEDCRLLAWARIGNTDAPAGWPEGTTPKAGVREHTKHLWDMLTAAGGSAPADDGDKWLTQFRAAVAGGAS